MKYRITYTSADGLTVSLEHEATRVAAMARVAELQAAGFINICVSRCVAKGKPSPRVASLNIDVLNILRGSK